MIASICSILLMLPLAASAASTQPVAGREIALDEAYRLALKRSEALAQQGFTIEELQARVDELWSNVRPRVALTGSQIWQDDPGPSAGGGGFNTFTQTSRPQAQITAHQPLFSGFREFLAVRTTKSQTEAARLQLKRAEQLIYQDVASAYTNLLSLHIEMRSRQALVDLTEERIKELRQRASIGRSRESEVLAARSQRAQAVADLESARGQERNAQALLRFLTGLEEDLFPKDVPLPAAEVVDPFLERAEKRADVAARRLDLESARSGVAIQSRQRLPSIALDGNYYLKRPAGFSEHIRWDATLSATLPLYYGGAISAQVRQAEARAKSAEQAVSLARRAAEREVRQAHAALDSSLSMVKALDTALELADANAKAQTADYRLGLVTNLEVLSALNSALQTRLNLDRARLQAALNRIQLEVASGGAQ